MLKESKRFKIGNNGVCSISMETKDVKMLEEIKMVFLVNDSYFRKD